MRLGDDALVFTKHSDGVYLILVINLHQGTRSLGFLSQTFLKAQKLEEVVVPMASCMFQCCSVSL